MSNKTKQLAHSIHKALILSHAVMFDTPGYQHVWILDNAHVFMSIKLKYKSSNEYYDITSYTSLLTSVSIDLALQHYIEYHT